MRWAENLVRKYCLCEERPDFNSKIIKKSVWLIYRQLDWFAQSRVFAIRYSLRHANLRFGESTDSGHWQKFTFAQQIILCHPKLLLSSVSFVLGDILTFLAAICPEVDLLPVTSEPFNIATTSLVVSLWPQELRQYFSLYLMAESEHF